MTNKDILFEWDKSEEQAFQQLTELMVSAPILAYPDPTAEYRVDTDASLEGIGAVLSQIQ